MSSSPSHSINALHNKRLPVLSKMNVGVCIFIHMLCFKDFTELAGIQEVKRDLKRTVILYVGSPHVLQN